MKNEYKKIDIFGPMVENYTLNQCVTIKAQIKKYRDQRANIYLLGMIAFFTIWGLIAGSVWVLDWAGVITFVEDEKRDLIAPLLIFLLFCMVMLTDMCAYDRLTKAVNERIDVLGGLQDGKKGEE